ncbi:MAG: GNAT family N-acetyltransferase [Solobacterium sp.]|nr:GNAT family N-acetyltransferase [Solobacterium sp.]
MTSITLKKWPAYDRTSLQDLYANTDQSKCINELPVPLPYDNTTRYLTAMETGRNNGRVFHCYAIYLHDSIIGKIELTSYDPENAEMDLIIRKEHTGKGYGSQAFDCLVSLARQENICRRIYAYVNVENDAMIAMLENRGFVKGRPFHADVNAEYNGVTFIRRKLGQEYIKDISTHLN